MINVLFSCAALGASGYSEASRNYIAALNLFKEEINLSVKSVSFERWSTDQSAYMDILAPLIGKPIKPDVQIVHMTPENFPSYRIPGIKNIGYTVWETTKLPAHWVPLCNTMDEIWVPCDWNIEVFKSSGVTVPVKKIEHTIDLQQFDNIEHVDLGLPKDKFIFYSIFQWTERKNPQGLIKAFLSEFSRNDNVVLVLKTYRQNNSEQDKKWIENEIGSIKNNMYLDDHAPIMLMHKMLSRQEILSLHKTGNCLVLPHRAEGWSNCLVPGTLVNTDRGLVKIEEVLKDDMVYSHCGALRKVTGVTNNFEFSKIIEIHRLGSDRAIKSTSNHPHLILPAAGQKFENIRKNLAAGKISPQWVFANKIKKGDFITIPKPQIKFNDSTLIDISSVLDNQYDIKNGELICNKSYVTNNLISLTTLAKEAGCSYQYVSETLINNSSSTKLQRTIQALAKNNKYTTPKSVSVKSHIEFSEDIAELFGMYIAEGWSDKSKICFSSHKNEVAGRTLIKSALKCITNANITEKVVGNIGKISCFSDILSKAFRQMFGRDCYSKRIPANLINSKWTPGILRGIFYGDGSVSEAKYTFSTSSHQLYSDITQALMCNNILAYMYLDRNNNYKIVIPKEFEEAFESLVKPYKYNSKIIMKKYNRCSNVLFHNNAFFVRVKNVFDRQYCGPVYNLHVDIDNSYTVDFMATHNCHFEAMAMDTPAIGTNFGGNTEFMNSKNSFLLDCYLTPVANMPWKLYNGKSMWAEPNIGQLQEYMRSIYMNYSAAQDRAAFAKIDVQKYSWENIGKKIVEELSK